MSGIDSLEYRLEQFIHSLDERRCGFPGSFPGDPDKRSKVEALARAIAQEFGGELHVKRPAPVELPPLKRKRKVPAK